MNIKFLTMATAGLAMIAAPVAASAATANSSSALSLSKSVRAGTTAKGKSKLGEGASVIPLVIGAAVVAGVAYLVIDKENDDDNSDSN
ncbi:MAG TPA: hypothetical protein VNJ10_04545 [Sphingomonas sp.]|nr:hypothetical protein [Sphingomonas sp.]